MLELPEALTLRRQLEKAVVGKRVRRVLPPVKPHKFCWFQGDPAAYDAQLRGRALVSAEAFGMFAEMVFDDGMRLCVNDGVNLRLLARADVPKAYQLLMEFDDGDALAFTVAMYGGIILHDGSCDNPYYLSSRAAVSPFAPQFHQRFDEVLAQGKPTLSLKALLATEQRFPGVGNGVLQDILFRARMHPKRKLATLSDAERAGLERAMLSTLADMRDGGGRDTEKDLFGQPGGYHTLMSRNTLASGCPVCGGPVTREAYLGGAVYFCPVCQRL